MPISLKDETIYDGGLATSFKLGQEGFSQQDLEDLRLLAVDIVQGKVDVVSIGLAPGVEFTEILDKRIREQLDQIFSPACTDPPFTDAGKVGNFTALHVDGERDLDGRYMQHVAIMVHCNAGRHENVNVPEGSNPADYDPFFLFGRVRKLDIHPVSLFQSFETFVPSIVVNLMNPTWNVFRAHGRHHSTAINVPVAHAVVPRVLAEEILDPQTEFLPMVNDDQYMRTNGKTVPISVNGRTTLKDGEGRELGVTRSYDLVNYPVGPSRQIQRTLVA